MRTAKTLIRLADAQADESSLGAQTHCWFCHEAAHFKGSGLLLAKIYALV